MDESYFEQTMRLPVDQGNPPVMQTKTCLVCGNTVGTEVSICPNCGSMKFSAAQAAAPAPVVWPAATAPVAPAVPPVAPAPVYEPAPVTPTPVYEPAPVYQPEPVVPAPVYEPAPAPAVMPVVPMPDPTPAPKEKPEPEKQEKSGGINTAGIIVLFTLLALLMVLFVALFYALSERAKDDQGDTMQSSSTTIATTTAPTTVPTTPTPETCVHNYTSAVTNPATYTSVGKMYYQCSICYHSYFEDIPMLVPEAQVTVLSKYIYHDTKVYDGYPNGKKYVCLDFMIYNAGTKTIQSVSGVLTIRCGEYEVSLEYERDVYGIAPSGYKIDVEQSFLCNDPVIASISPSRAKAYAAIYEAPADQLQFEFQVTDIQFVE